MNLDRRTFIKLAGLAAVGLLARPFYGVLVRPGEALAANGTGAVRRAMVVDLNACTGADGCRDCILACHQAHNVPDFGNPKDEIKWMQAVPYSNAFLSGEHAFQAEGLSTLLVPLLCNHCDNPPCVRVCPTGATWRRDDGIVMMDYHRCIGCRYCMAACPFGSRSFNWRDPRPFIAELNPDYPTRSKGVVEKCNFCDERLAKGLQPACVDACQEKALVFGDLMQKDSRVRQLLAGRYSIVRRGELGTRPHVYYLV